MGSALEQLSKSAAANNRTSSYHRLLNVFLTISIVISMVSGIHAQQGRQEASSPELEGFADIHVHQMANLGFGGSIVWGNAGGDPQELGPIPAPMRRGHDAVEGATHGYFIAKLLRTLTNVFLGDWFRHGEEGYPSFRSWPSVNRWTHQQVYKAWLFRAYQGGLRLMVMLAVNSEDQFGRGEDEIPLVRHKAEQKVKAPGRTGNDMEALDWQIRAAYELQAEIDQENGGTGKGWYRIVRDPDEASRAISEGRLAVILGTELQHLFNCDMDRPACGPDVVIEGLNRLEAMGVNYVFPLHHKLNQFGGAAKFSFANNGPSGPCPDHQPRYEHSCSAVGLTKLGEFLIEELSSRGMFIDTEHMGWRTFDDTMKIVENRNYPVLAGHVIPFDLAVRSNKEDRTERAKTKEQIQRIFDVGGIVAPMLGTAAGQYQRSGYPAIPIHCRTTDGGGVDQWANAYLFLRPLAGEDAIERISLGTDWNGFAGWPGPRGACAPKEEKRVTYPFLLPKKLKPAAIQPVSTMTLYEWPAGVKKWDFNEVGAAHAGMLPDFLEDVRLLGVTRDELEPIYRSARAVVKLWSESRNRAEPWSHHHLRWIPQSPFDTFDFPGALVAERGIEASPGFGLCRSRAGHKLGFLRGKSCELVEPPVEEVRSPGQLMAYFDGRCLTGGSSWKIAPIVQKMCGTEANQRWYLRRTSDQVLQIENSLTGLCVTSRQDANGRRPRIIEDACVPGDPNQQWRYQRSGNSFELIGASGRCLEVQDQSRADGAAIQESACTVASNQLWLVEALRQNDYETLYQADKGRYAWLVMPNTSYPHDVAVSQGERICRAADGLWVGVVHADQCVGKTYRGQQASTPRFETLYQAP